MLRLFVLLLLVLQSCPIWAAAAPTPVTLTTDAEGQHFSGRLQLLIDPSKQMTLKEVQQAPASAFTTPAEAIRYSYDPSVYWLRLDVQGDPLYDWVLELSSVAIAEASLYGPIDANGRSHAAPVDIGYKRPFANRQLASENTVFRFHLPSAEPYTFYLKLQSELPQRFQPRIRELGQYTISVRTRQLIDGLCYGALLAMLLYNLMLLNMVRDRTYVWYVLTVFFAVISISGYNGHLAHYLISNTPELLTRCYNGAPVLWALFTLLFSRDFLGMQRHTPKLYQSTHVVFVLLLVAFGAAMVENISVAQGLTELVAAVAAVLLIIAAILTARQGFHPALWYLLGQLTLHISAIIVIADNRSFISSPWMRSYGLQTGAALEVVIFALAMGSRMRMMQLKNRELRARTDVLAAAAETDSLTGVANRAGLIARADRLLHTGQHALVLIDLNRFKPVNDQFGHDAGDKVLIEVARRLEEQLRESDIVARLGGDEFVVLLSGQHERNVISSIAVRLVDRIGMPIRVDSHQLEVGSSLGIALCPEHSRKLDELLKAADKAMYLVKGSKHAGFAFADETMPKPASASS
ncbi:diguanylate cyclase domain-containing protein [Chitinimonas sp. PSY-7]|uniref:diguanylate cyclase domain-containing protein n=1 Tax=Chitinimonas sp. PSY-7 TaxID=3459088 RepID=UPI00403FD138